MKEQKTYDLKKVMTISLAASLIFVLLIYLASLTLGRFQSTLLPDEGAAWYYWKLPEISFWATVTAWSLYILHQVSVWWLIIKLGRQTAIEDGKAGPLNIKLLTVNAVFIFLHILQTIFFYDALAQNVPVMSSQGSVIVMLVMILILLNARRGLFFGKKIRLPAKGVASVFKIHGIFISWALVYTFWFHPTEGTIGHLMGFFYIFILMIQMSLAKTKWHNNIKWITILEVYVAVHGTIVAIEAGQELWSMFFFGFLMMFVVTQMYGVVKNKKGILAVSAVYVLAAILVYSGIFGNGKTFADIHQVTWIPIILYSLVFVITWLLHGASSVMKKINS